MPSPSSITLISFMPDSSMLTWISEAPASMEFSISSLTTELGRSTTSPAAILFCIFGSRIFILVIMIILYHAGQFGKLLQPFKRRQSVHIHRLHRLDHVLRVPARGAL